jgi:hypothetical protein
MGSISNTGDALNEKLAAPSLLRVLKENPSRQIILSERSCSQLYEKSAEAASPSRRLPQGKVRLIWDMTMCCDELPLGHVEYGLFTLHCFVE